MYGLTGWYSVSMFAAAGVFSTLEDTAFGLMTNGWCGYMAWAMFIGAMAAGFMWLLDKWH